MTKILAKKIVSLYAIFFLKIVYLYRFKRYIFEYRCPPLTICNINWGQEKECFMIYANCLHLNKKSFWGEFNPNNLGGSWGQIFSVPARPLRSRRGFPWIRNRSFPHTCWKIRLIEGHAKCLKILTCKGALRMVFICLSPPPPPLHTVYVYRVYLFTQGRGERGGELNQREG